MTTTHNIQMAINSLVGMISSKAVKIIVDGISIYDLPV